MSGNSIGEQFRITTWGESHGKAIGVVIDGCPPNLELSEQDIQEELDKRRPGISKASTQRKDSDKPVILSGLFEGKTTGTPISIIVFNHESQSKNYEAIKNIYRPGHADFTYQMKYGIRDYRDDGRSSVRETVGRIISGAVAKKIINKTKIYAYTKELGGISIKKVVLSEIEKNDLKCPDKLVVKKMLAKIETVKKLGNSIGGIIEILIKDVPVGLGEPVFDKLSADFSKALMSIGAIKGIEIGLGFEASRTLGSANNDEFIFEKNKITTKTNNSGGILGGISTGNDIIIRVAVKPIPSISLLQKTVDEKGVPAEIEVKGMHDICAIPRINIVCEAMCAIVLADHLLRQKMIK
jgi:chorismate synthase